jgi:hypothetical protein
VIEIRGQVPTPQVVTVRPREVPNYSRQVLVPNFYNHDFWQSILPGYQVVPRRAIQGNRALDSLVNNSPMTAGAGAPGDASAPLFTTPATRAAMSTDSLAQELRQRQQRIEALRARMDTLYAPGGVKPSVLDTLPPLDATRRTRTPGDTTTARPPRDTTTTRPPSGTGSATTPR